jgi:outer membrane protein assembly factor BamB
VGPDGTIYIGSWDGKLYALRDRGNRAELAWEYTAGPFVVSSPAIGPDGTIYVGSGDTQLHAINPDGTPRWTFATGDWVDSSPAVGPDGAIYVGSWDGALYAVTPGGALRWKVQSGGSVLGSPALAGDGTVYFGSRDGRVYAVNPAGAVLWAYQTGDAVETSPALGADGTIYVGSDDGRMYALRPDGTVRWRFPAEGQAALPPLQSSVAVRADGSIVFGSANSAVYSLRPDGTQLWRTTVLDAVEAAPLVAPDGAVYVGSYDRRIYALNGTQPPGGTDWPQFGRDPQRTGWQPLGPAPGGTGRLVNLSVRSRAGTDGDTLIVGFVAQGAGERRLLVRGVGPTLGLPPFNVAGALADPELRLFDGGVQPLAANDNWSGSAGSALVAGLAAQLGAFPLPDPSLDAALVRDLTAPSGNTAHLTGKGGAAGVALVEVYDAGGGVGVRLANASARTRVGSGAEVLIAGFVVSGGSRTVLVRGVGPTLAAFNVPGVLGDPVLRLFRGDRILAENNDWSVSTQAVGLAAAAQAVGAFSLPAGSRDPALLVTLPEGAYTAQVSGAAGTTGVALVEVYDVP